MPNHLKLDRLIDDLSNPSAYPHDVKEVEVRQTHISVVFLAGDFVYKVKKPVDFGFLDFSTLEKRRHFCEEEVRLNRRLAHDVYLEVIPLSIRDNKIVIGESDSPIEFAVKMRRLPEEATFQAMLETGELTEGDLQESARLIADFHKAAERGEHISSFGKFDTVAGNARENFDQTAEHVGETVSQRVHERLNRLTEEELIRLRPLIEKRAAEWVPCDTHGDLHLDHIYKIDGELMILDCIEFNERFRYADPVSDMAFLCMDLLFSGKTRLSQYFANDYFESSGDLDGRGLLPFYTAYRAIVRAKVKGMEATEKEVPKEDRLEALKNAQAHWLLGLSCLEPPEQRPALLLVGGLPGTGKSTLAAGLAKIAGFEVLRSDVIRKEIAKGEGDIYTSEWTKQTYNEMLVRAQRLLFEGKRVIADATFREHSTREDFLDAARTLCVPTHFFVCIADRAVVRERLQQRTGDVSDADWDVYLKLESSWEEPNETAGDAVREIDTGDTAQAALDQTSNFLKFRGLLT